MRMIKLAGLLLMASPWLQAQPQVTVQETQALNEKGLVVEKLAAGRMLDVEPCARDARLMQFTRGDKILFVRKSDLGTLETVSAGLQKRQIDAQAEQVLRKTELQRLEAHLRMLQVQKVELERDSVLSYRIVRQVYTEQGVVMSDSYSRVISSTKAARAVKELQAQQIKTAEQIQQAGQALAQSLQSAKRLELEAAFWRQRFISFDASQEAEAAPRFLVKPGAQIFYQNRVIGQLEAGKVISLQPHPREKGWWQFSHEGKDCAVDGRFLVNLIEAPRKLDEEALQLDLALQAQDAATAAADRQVLLLQAAISQMEVVNALSGQYGSVKNYSVKVDETTTLEIKVPAEAEAAYVDLNRSKKQVEAWMEQMKQSRQISQQGVAKHAELRKRLVDLASRRTELEALLASPVVRGP